MILSIYKKKTGSFCQDIKKKKMKCSRAFDGLLAVRFPKLNV